MRIDMMKATTVGGVLVGAAALMLTGCGSNSVAQNQGSGNAVTIHYKLVPSDGDGPKTGPDGKAHDTFAALDPTTVHVGDKVTVVVANYDSQAHGMVFPDLGLSEVVKAGTDSAAGQTTFTFTATKAGALRWYCPVPCDSDADNWAMTAASAGPDQDGFMAGTITVA